MGLVKFQDSPIGERHSDGRALYLSKNRQQIPADELSLRRQAKSSGNRHLPRDPSNDRTRTLYRTTHASTLGIDSNPRKSELPSEPPDEDKNSVARDKVKSCRTSKAIAPMSIYYLSVTATVIVRPAATARLVRQRTARNEQPR